MAKYLGLNVTLAVDEDDAGAGLFAVIGQIMDINGPNAETTAVQTTTRDSADVTHEFLGGFIDSGELTIDVVFDVVLATQLSLITLQQSRAEVPWKITWPTGTSKMATFRGFVKSVGPAAPLEDKLTCTFTVKVTKKITWNAVAA